MVLRNIVRNALRSGHLPGTAPKVASYVAVAVRMLTRALFRVCPFIRRAWLKCVLRLYQWLFGYINFVASECFHSSPKHVFEWGVASFVVPRVRPGARVLDVGCGRGELAWQVGQIAANIRRAMAAQPGKRVLLVIGAGHKPWLDQILGATLDMKVVQWSELD